MDDTIKKPRRFVVLTILGILFIISGITSIPYNIRHIKAFPQYPFNNFLHFVFSGLAVASGFGVLKLKKWGRSLAIFYVILASVFSFLWGFFLGDEIISEFSRQQRIRGLFVPEISWQIIGRISLLSSLLLTVFVIFYLTRPKVKQQFIN